MARGLRCCMGAFWRCRGKAVTAAGGFSYRIGDEAVDKKGVGAAMQQQVDAALAAYQSAVRQLRFCRVDEPGAVYWGDLMLTDADRAAMRAGLAEVRGDRELMITIRRRKTTLAAQRVRWHAPGRAGDGGRRGGDGGGAVDGDGAGRAGFRCAASGGPDGVPKTRWWRCIRIEIGNVMAWPGWCSRRRKRAMKTRRRKGGTKKSNC